MTNAELLAEAIAAVAILIRAYLGWYLALVAALTVLLLALIAALNTLVARLRHPSKD